MKQHVCVWFVVLALGAGCSSAGNGVALPGAALSRHAAAGYTIEVLGSLGGTNSAANTINDRGFAMGTSFLSGNTIMHAALWQHHAAIDLRTLGGPNSAVEWQVQNTDGYVSGISETSKKDPLGESKQWSCHAFLPDAGSSGDTCLGFVWHDRAMQALPALGGNNGYAAGMNGDRTIAGWAETAVHDSTCVLPQKLQFLPVVWDAKTLAATKLPTLTVNGKLDPDGAATAVNDSGDVVGISGICDQAVGRFTARHAVIWHDGQPIELKTFGGVSWNTPTAINDAGQIVGFLNKRGAKDKQGVPNFVSAFWNSATEKPVEIKPLPGDQLGEPTAINASGQVLGVSIPSSHAYLWKNGGKLVDLTMLLATAYPKLKLVSVGGIDDKGEISGQACELVSGTCPASNATMVTIVAIPR